MVNALRYNEKNKFNDFFINSLRQPVFHVDTDIYLNPENANEKLRIDEERLIDWRRNLAKFRGKD